MHVIPLFPVHASNARRHIKQQSACATWRLGTICSNVKGFYDLVCLQQPSKNFADDPKSNQSRLEIMNLTVNIEKRLQNLYERTEKDILSTVWSQNMQIAPYVPPNVPPNVPQVNT